MERKANAIQSGTVLALISAAVIICFCSGCGLVNPGSKGYFEMSGDANGVNSFVQGFSHQDAFWKQRALEEQQVTVRETSPGFWSGIFGGSQNANH